MKHTYVDSMLRSRAAVLEFVCAAVLLALGVNLIAGVLVETLGARSSTVIVTGILLTFISLGLVAHRMLAASARTKRISGFFCYNKEENELVTVDRYPLSEALSEYFVGLFSENEAPRRLWERDPISKTFEICTETGNAKLRRTAAGQLVIEACEYFVLDKLSTHLTDYFNGLGVKKDRLKVFRREDVPTVVFRNRFLDTFSKPMQERSAFVEETLSDTHKDQTVCLSFGAEGQRYDNFELVLPAGATVNRISPSCVEVDSRRFKLRLNIEFDAFGTVLPRGFERNYLKADFSRAFAYMLNIAVHVSIKPLAFLSPKGWELHRWLDSFVNSLDKDASKKRFLKRIRWESASTVSRIIRGTEAKRMQGAKRDREAAPN